MADVRQLAGQDHETLDRSLKLAVESGSVFASPQRRRTGFCYAGLVGIQHLKGLAENELNQRAGAGRDRMHNCRSTDPNLSVGVESDVFPEPRSRTGKADNILALRRKS
jgi:hypothetical protein